MQEYLPLAQDLVRAYANRVIAKWTQNGSNQQTHEEVLFSIAWGFLPIVLKNTVGPMMSRSRGVEYNDQFFDKAVVSEVTHVKNETPHHQQ